MLKKTITYTDYNDVERTEDFYFNLTKSELVEMELSTEGGLMSKLERLSGDPDGVEIMKIFKDIILKSYGEKSSDGKRFIKSEEISEAFSQTEAYNILFMELVTDAEKAAEFAEAIIPNFEPDASKISPIK